MADYLKTLKGEELVQISADFDYIKATADFVGLKLMPMVKTENMKVAMYNLLKGSDIPVVALVHALDSEARIGDRAEYEEIKASLFLIKEKINQGEELRKKIKDLGMSADERTVINAIYDDINNEISKVLTGFERRACELLSTGKIVINENGATSTVDYKLNEKNKKPYTGWNNVDHDIIADLIDIKKLSKNKIVRQIMSGKLMGYILANKKLNAIASASNVYVTEDWAKSYILAQTGIQIFVDDRTFKTSYADNKEYRFFPEDVVISLTTLKEVGKTFVTSTPMEDANETDTAYGFVTVDMWKTHDPYTTWTKAEGIGLPVIADINNTLYLSKIS